MCLLIKFQLDNLPFSFSLEPFSYHKMNRLLQIELTEADKNYLRDKARDGVCASVNDHDCYLGLNFNQYFVISKPFLDKNNYL